jgi:hypothetical protein
LYAIRSAARVGTAGIHSSNVERTSQGWADYTSKCDIVMP